jgi:hypothetical protein
MRLTSAETMKVLHQLYCLFDDLSLEHNTYKLDTVGDA